MLTVEVQDWRADGMYCTKDQTDRTDLHFTGQYVAYAETGRISISRSNDVLAAALGAMWPVENSGCAVNALATRCRSLHATVDSAGSAPRDNLSSTARDIGGTAQSPYLHGQLKNDIYVLLSRDRVQYMELDTEVKPRKLLSEGNQPYKHPSIQVLSSSRT